MSIGRGVEWGGVDEKRLFAGHVLTALCALLDLGAEKRTECALLTM